jgi:hypothetical protein
MGMAQDPEAGSVADRRKIHAASMLYLVPYTERVRAEACGNIELTFYDLLNQLHTGHDAPGVEEALEAEHWTHPAFHPPVFLFDNIVQVGASADLDGIFPNGN